MSSTRCVNDRLNCKGVRVWRLVRINPNAVGLQMPLNESNVVAKARRLLVCTIDAANFSDKVDIIFVAEMIEKIGKFVEEFKDVSKELRRRNVVWPKLILSPPPPLPACLDASSGR